MKKFIKFLSFILAIFSCACFAFSACGGEIGAGKTDNADLSNILVAYFSATGNTEKVARYIAEATGGTLYEIKPQVPYTQEDLNYGDSTTRATREQRDPDARPATDGSVRDMDSYGVIFLGYPFGGEKRRKLYIRLSNFMTFRAKR